MKRFISIFICISVSLSLIPSFYISAEENNINLAVKSNITTKYIASQKLVSGVEPGTPVNELINCFDNSEDISIRDENGNINTESVKTGDRIYVGNDYAAQVVIYGDCNSDSVINAKDLLIMRKNLAEIVILNDIQLIAFDINRDSALNSKDILFLRQYFAEWHGIRNSSLYYVSKDGNDSNDGSFANPYLTVQKASDVMTAGDTCFIMEGVYRETVTPANEGENGAPITFTAYENDSVTISGTEKITSQWSLYKDGIYKTQTNLWRGNENQVFADGKMATLCRYPNKNSDNVISVGDTLTATAASSTNISGSIPFVQNDLVGAKIATEGTNHYIYYSSTVTANTSSSANFSQINSGWDSPTTGSNFYFYDKLNLLDDENEWYYDSNGTIYYKPANGVDINDIDIEYSTRGQAFTLGGKSYINISGLEIYGATVRTDTGSDHLTLDSNKVLYFYHSNITRNYPWDADWWGLELHGEYSVVKNCEIAYGAEGGVEIYADHCSVVNNYIHDINYINSNAAAVEPRRCEYTLISHNTIKNIARSAIVCSSINLRICYNDISNCGVNTYDVSGIGAYKIDAKNTIEIDHNIIHDCNDGKMFVAYYLDNGSMNFTVHHNVTYDVDSVMTLNNPSYGNRIYNNTFVRCGSIGTGNLQNPYDNNNFIGSVWTGDQFYNNIMPSVYYGDGAYFSNNLFKDDPNIQFTDAENNDFSLTENSIAAGTGTATALESSNTDIGAYEYGSEAWEAGYDLTANFDTVFSLSALDTNFVPTSGNVFEEIKNASSGTNILSNPPFESSVSIKNGWVEKIFDVQPGQVYYMSCNAAFTNNPSTYMEYGVHFLDSGFNIKSQGGFLYTQAQTNKLETVFVIPEGCTKLRYFAAVWSNQEVIAGDFKLIRLW